MSLFSRLFRGARDQVAAAFVAFFKAELVRVSQLDGKPGLSAEDVRLLLRQIREANLMGGDWKERKARVESWIRRELSERVTEEAVVLVAVHGYQLAKRTAVF